jgi:hypothetical protein
MSSVSLTSPRRVERALVLDATQDTMARVGEMLAYDAALFHGFYTNIECWRRHDNDVLTMDQRDTTTTDDAVSSVAQSPTRRHRRCDLRRLQNALLVDSNHRWGRKCHLCWSFQERSHFVWLERSWLFEKGRNLNVSCVLLCRLISLGMLDYFPDCNITAEVTTSVELKA